MKFSNKHILYFQMFADMKPCDIPCEPITISQCTSQANTHIGFPNIFNQASQTAAAKIAQNIDLVVAEGCYHQTTEFLCGLLLPECRENKGLVFPSRQMCKEFIAGCGEFLKGRGETEFIFDCETLFSENPEPICSAQPVEPVNEPPVEESPLSTKDSDSGKYLLVTRIIGKIS